MKFLCNMPSLDGIFPAFIKNNIQCLNLMNRLTSANPKSRSINIKNHEWFFLNGIDFDELNDPNNGLFDMKKNYDDEIFLDYNDDYEFEHKNCL